MEIEKQVCTLEQAKEFDKLGVDVGTLWRWCDWDCDKWELVSSEDCTEGEGSLPAYTCAELWRLFEQILHSMEDDSICYDYLRRTTDLMYRFQVPATHTLADRIIKDIGEGIIKPEDLKL